ncbi:MAG TPA: Spy/CpxP family protein refolding chaperone [Thermoanaerobaculia bacterium]|nr:Spy/CpxP family protein refolding chaperone [Thermoanaerobaculia bacterium]
MKRLLIIVTIFLLTASLLCAAEGPTLEQRRVTEYLQLTAAQQTAWDNARADFESASAPLFERIRQSGRDMEVALKNKSADACTIGNMMLAQQAIVDQIRTQKEAFDQRLESILTPDQKTKYEAFKAAQPRTLERRKISGD